MKRRELARKAVWAAGVLVAVMCCGCPAAQESAKQAPSGKQGAEPALDAAQKAERAADKAEKMAAAAERAAEKAEQTAEAAAKTAAGAEKTAESLKTAELEEQPPPDKERDLGPPLVDDPKALRRLDPKLPVWIDAEHKQIVFLAATCAATYPLEFFATLRDRSYESVVATDVRPFLVHTGLLAVGAKPGKPARFDANYTPPTGMPVEIEVRWKDKEGKVQKAPAQQWVRNIRTKKALDVDWVFAGSGFFKDKEGRERYLADSGDFITVLNLPTAMLDVPMKSVGALESRSYEGFVENMPPPGTPVTVVLKPKLDR
jgi:hypothetical protein